MMSAPATRPARAARDKSQKPVADQNNKTPDAAAALKLQPTAEQIRIAQIIHDTKDTDDPEFRNKIKQVVELTGKSNDEASVALHDCDNDPNRAIDMLLDGETDQGEWETSGKRKKNRPPTVAVVEPPPPPVVVPSSSSSNNKENRQRSERGRERDGGKEPRNRGPPRLNRGRGRDSENNERNLEDSRSRDKSGEHRNRGVMNGSASRGGGRGRVASGIGRVRTFQNRGAAQTRFNRPIDTWTNVGTEPADTDQQMSVGKWSDGFPPAEDWDNEDWTGSLAETKVFTPSAHVASDADNDVAGTALHPGSIAPPLPTSGQAVGEGPSLSASQATATGASVLRDDDVCVLDAVVASDSSSVTLNHLKPYTALTGSSMDSSFSSSNLSSALGALQQIPLKSAASSLANSLPASGGGRLSGSPMVSVGQQLRPKVARSRGPTSSKIPSMAVEMPDDAIANLDVQFGSLEFGGEQSSLGFNSLLKNTSSLQSLQSTSSSITSAPNTNQSPSSSLPSSSLSNSILRATSSGILKNGPDSSDLVQPTAVPSYAQSQGVSLMNVGQDVAQAVSQINSNDSNSFAGSSDNRNAVSFSGGVQRSSSTTSTTLESVSNKLSESGGIGAYGLQDNSSSGGGHSAYQSPYGSHNKSAGSFSHHHQQQQQQQQVQQQQQHHSNVSASVQQQQSQSLYGGSVSGPTASSLAAAQQQAQSTASYSSVPQSVYGSGSQTPQSSFGQSSVYANPVATVSTYASGSSISQTGYSLQSHSSLHSSGNKLPSSLANTVKEAMDSSSSQHMYDTSHTTSSSSLTSPLTTPSSSAASSALGLAAGALSNNNSLSISKSSISTNKSGPPSMPPGVPMVHSHQYIMGQASLPFYGLPQPMYTYEDLQMVPQRLPMASYYDMSFQPSTTLTGRDGGLSNVAYSNTDGKFTRGDNSSPVPTTLSQQSSSQQHQQQQTFISPTALPHPYGYYYPSQVVAGGFAQYGTPIFPMPPATNAHGVTTNTHFQKPNAYGSHGYTSGYENLGQSQDYSKNNYGSGSQNQSKVMAGTSAGGSANSVGGNDIPASVYSKTHSQMNKQSFDKPGFHAGTPPPFNMASNQPGSLGGPSTAYAAQFIPMMTQHPSPMMHHQLHQDSGNASQRLGSAQSKATASSKQAYGTSYWNTT